MDNITVETTNDAITICLSGNMSIQDAVTLKETFETQIPETSILKIDMNRLEYIDLPCLQVLCSADTTAAEKGVRMSIEGSIPEEIKKIINDAAFGTEPLFLKGDV